MNVDKERLREAISQVDATGCGSTWKSLVLIAAREHLKSLEAATPKPKVPTLKEVERACRSPEQKAYLPSADRDGIARAAELAAALREFSEPLYTDSDDMLRAADVLLKKVRDR